VENDRSLGSGRSFSVKRTINKSLSVRQLLPDFRLLLLIRPETDDNQKVARAIIQAGINFLRISAISNKIINFALNINVLQRYQTNQAIEIAENKRADFAFEFY